MVGLSYELEGFCNSCRTVYWPPYVSNDRKINHIILEELAKEVEITYSVLVYYNGDSELLSKTLLSAKGPFAPKDIIICVDESFEDSIIKVYEEFKKLYSPIYVCRSSEGVFKDSAYKASGQYLYFMEIGNKINKSPIIHINNMINEHLKPIYMVVDDNFTICSKRLFSVASTDNKSLSQVYNELYNSEEYKETVVKWPLQ